MDVSNDATAGHMTAGALDVAFHEAGPSGGPAVVLLHGFPYDVRCFGEVVPRLTRAGRRVVVPSLRGFGSTRFVDADVPRVGQQAALGTDLIALLDALRIERSTVAGFDWGGRAACVVAALRPDRVDGLVSGGSGYNLQDSDAAGRPAAPDVEQRSWYWFYLNSARGADALRNDRSGFCRHLWRFFSPTWRFDDATFERTAASFDNPDFVEVVLHSYRYRIGEVAGDPALAGMEHRLSQKPRIDVPAIVLSGEDDGVDPPADMEKLAPNFGDLRRRTILPGVGHNIPQEAPAAFADAILELGG